MKKVSKIVGIISLIIALSFLVYGFGLSRYKVYDKPDARDEGKLSTSTTMTESQLLREMCYDAIIKDKDGNLVNKGREAACLT
ncbi:MAG: hypothetical protein V1701_09555 [Planctomycetota bacterium]